MRRLLVATVALALAGLAAGAALDDREVAFEVGLPAVRPAAELAPGAQVCRDGIDAPAAFERVRLVVGTFARPGPALDVSVAGRRGEVAGGYADNSSVEAAVGGVEGRLRVCVRNAGTVPVVLFGSPPDTPPDLLGDPNLAAEPAVVFVREPPDSMLSLIPEAFDRAVLFKTGRLGAWTVWALLAAMALGVPAALAAAYTSVRSSSRSDAGSERAAS